MIETERLILRRFTGEDWEDLYGYLSDPEVVFYEPYPPFSMEECKKEALRRAGDEGFWAVCIKETKKLIGNITLMKADFDTFELGYVFHSEYQGKGYATESAVALVTYAFQQLNAHRVIALCNPENEKSWRLLERLNMRREGHLIKNIYFKKNEFGQPIWQDTYMYAVLDSEWALLQKEEPIKT